MAEAAQPPPVKGDAVDWVQSRVPAWLLILLAGLGTPTSIGAVWWNQNSETKMALMTQEISSLREKNADLSSALKSSLAELRTEVNLRPSIKEIQEIKQAVEELQRAIDVRVTRPERMEMLATLERTDADLYRRIDRLQEIFYQQPRQPVPSMPYEPLPRRNDTPDGEGPH